jgi:hypothetical protein
MKKLDIYAYFSRRGDQRKQFNLKYLSGHIGNLGQDGKKIPGCETVTTFN